MPGLQDPIESPGLVLCEGLDDFAVLLSLLRHLQIDRTIIEVEQLTSRTQLHDRLNGLPIRDSLRRLRALAIVCDADDPDDGPSAFGRVRNDLINTGFTSPTSATQIVHGRWDGGVSLSVGVWVMPDNQVTGAVQDLCLSAINADPGLACVDAFLDCVSRAAGVVWRPQDKSKARLNSWLASRPNPTRRSGQAMDADVIDRNSHAFDGIKDFLRRLAEAASQPITPAP